MKDIKVVKDSLRIMDANYVSSEKIDEDSYDLRFTYKKRNYILHINRKYKLMMVETTDSIYGMNINCDTLELINYIREMITFTEFEEYNVFSLSLRKEVKNGYIEKILQVTKEVDSGDIIFDSESIDFNEIVEDKPKVIPYYFGLNNFDKRIFVDDWLEDFNEKVVTLSEEDLFIMESTLISYYYKILNNMWEGDMIDPFLASYSSSILYEEITRRLKGRTFEDWFNEWETRFDKENIEKYLNSKNEGKSKELN